MIAVKKPLFNIGQVVATPGAIEALERAKVAPWELISRHVAGDWGIVDSEDTEFNNEALKDGSRILSAYKLATGEKLWIITEAEDECGNRAATSILRPEEY